jgi:hypothetical protein
VLFLLVLGETESETDRKGGETHGGGEIDRETSGKRGETDGETDRVERLIERLTGNVESLTEP